MPAGNTDPRGVAGIGIDIVENRRVEDALARHGRRFRNRIFRKSEQDYCDQKARPALHYASRFAVKEAVAKAFGTGIGAELGWLDIEVVRDGGGAPVVMMLGKGAELARKMNIDRIYVSLSHTHQYAAATALLAVKCPRGPA
ncbi:MAG TPA: holo-ACP synthase [Kiritimatiellia bacterium]|nr:holo-ACP synthase [Kiritimatiellia bacterium]HNS80640.1 holo-ACP synthase [Kiritimatiellia bacterium]HPA77709.1 holo-ACP synthase [Kiritimatiellia bacterium]HQQ03804.1 holo-ACP synthase [Kiritimatiellia bacterium]